MKTIADFINESIVNIDEWKQDLMPQCVIVMGGPGAGKTYWMDHEANEFFKHNITFRKLDSDWNLQKYQKLHINEFAENMILYCSSKAIHDDARNQKDAFFNYLKDQQEKMNDACDAVGSKGMYIDLGTIDWSFVKSWVKRYDLARDDYKTKVLDEFKKAFQKEYFKKLFASDFSVRGLSKAEYKKDFQDKLRGEMKDIDFRGPSDIVIAITGDDLEKFQQIADICGETHSITVVYLNVPEELSELRDKKRDRSVGLALIQKKLKSIHDTWDELVRGAFKEIGIFKMVEMVPTTEAMDDARSGKKYEDGEQKPPQWKVGKEYLNTDLIKNR